VGDRQDHQAARGARDRPADTAIRHARAMTDRLDARALARLLAAGSLDDVWVADEQTWVMRRRLSRRAQLVLEARGPRTRSTPWASGG